VGVGGNGRCGAGLERCCDGKKRCGEDNAGAGAKKEKRRPKEGELESGGLGFGVRGSGSRVSFPRLGIRCWLLWRLLHNERKGKGMVVSDGLYSVAGRALGMGDKKKEVRLREVGFGGLEWFENMSSPSVSSDVGTWVQDSKW